MTDWLTVQVCMNTLNFYLDNTAYLLTHWQDLLWCYAFPPLHTGYQHFLSTHDKKWFSGTKRKFKIYYLQHLQRKHFIINTCIINYLVCYLLALGQYQWKTVTDVLNTCMLPLACGLRQHFEAKVTVFSLYGLTIVWQKNIFLFFLIMMVNGLTSEFVYATLSLNWLTCHLYTNVLGKF